MNFQKIGKGKMGKLVNYLAVLFAAIAVTEAKLPEPPKLAADSITSVTVSYDAATNNFKVQDGVASDSGAAYARYAWKIHPSMFHL